MRLLVRGFLAVWEKLGRRSTVQYLAELDARTIKDIGLESWRTPLGAEVERLRRSS